MKTIKGNLAVSVVALAVQGALAAMMAIPLAAYAQGDDPDVAALTNPTNTVEIGVGYTSKDSAKFGEYNGLDKKGFNAIGNVDIRGGNAYGQGDGTRTWEVKGVDLGTTAQQIGVRVGDQGTWSLGVGFDQLRHYGTDSYQTPFQGSMGGNNFTLPSNFGVINTAIKAAYPGISATVAPGANALTKTQLADFGTQEVYTDRQNTALDGSYIFDSHWSVKADYNHLKQSGAKLLGVAGDQANGVIGNASYIAAGQSPMVLMNPTNYSTDNFNLALNWVGDKGHASLSYYGSLFRDGYNSVMFNNPFVKSPTTAAYATGSLYALPTDSISTMPSNEFHQVNLTGGYAFSSATKLAGGFSYGRNTQNDAYAATGLTPSGIPQSSLNGLVVTTHADMKLTNQTSKDLVLSAGFKYNQRDNQTASTLYLFNTVNEAFSAATAGGALNAPMSNKKTQIEIAGDYRIDNKQKLRLSYENEKIDRWCNNAAANTQVGTFATGNNLVGSTAAPTSCAEVPASKENKLSAAYKFKATDDVVLNASYGYARRKADINPAFYNPMQTTNPLAGSSGEGYEALGFMAYFDASRTENMFKAGVSWQANDRLTLTLNGRYSADDYDSTYGVQKGKSYSLNVDATYAYSENSSVSAYATTQIMSRDMTNLATVGTGTPATATTLGIPAGSTTWTNKLTENDITVGLNGKQRGLMGGKLQLAEDLTYSVGKSSYGTQFNYLSQTSAGVSCSAAVFQTCGDLPDIHNTMLQLRLSGAYQLDKVSKVMLGYTYQRLKSDDYFYNAYQYGSTAAAMLPTNQQAPNYNVNTVFVAYNYSFR